MPVRQPPGGLLQGTLGILILKVTVLGPAHGYATARCIEDTSDDSTAGRKHLRNEAEVWLRYSKAVTRVLRAEPALA